MNDVMWSDILSKHWRLYQKIMMNLFLHRSLWELMKLMIESQHFSSTFLLNIMVKYTRSLLVISLILIHYILSNMYVN